MNLINELNIHADALSEAINENPKFFASIKHYVHLLKDATQPNRGKVSQDELRLLAGKIEHFFSQYRSSGYREGIIYIPPSETSNSDTTVKEINGLVGKLSSMSEEAFDALFPQSDAARSSRLAASQEENNAPCVFIGHGRSKLWMQLKIFLEDDLKLATVTYESEPRAGESIIPILEKMLNQASFALLVLTAEDETIEGNKRARQNVVHEAGLFQGRLGFTKAIVLRQEGLEGFTNVDGLQYISFSEDKIEQTFYELQRVFKREKLV